MEVAPPVSHRHDSKPCFEGQQPLGVPGWIATELLTLRLTADIRRNGASGYMPTAMKSEESPKPEGLGAGDRIERGQLEAGDGAFGGGGGGGGGREEGAVLGRAGAVGLQAGPAQETSQLDPRAPVRKGKWTPEEEMYTTRIINDFNKGLLPLAPGTTLRSYLSEKLNCDPMRITKKFAGASCIGKRVFMPAERTPENLVETHRSRRDLEEMARKFHNRLETMRPGAGGSGRSSGSGVGSSGGGSSRGAGVLGSTPAQSNAKARRSPATGSGAVGGCGGTGASSSIGGGARRGESSAGSGAKPSAARRGEGVGDSGGSGACSSRSPSPGAHGPHSACDDSAPHPEGSPGRRSRSWERDEEGGYGQYDSMDQSPSGADSDDSERHCGGGGGIIGSAPFAGDSGRGGSYGGNSHSHAEGQSHRGHSAGYSRCSYDACLVGGRGNGDQEVNDYGRSSSSGSGSSSSSGGGGGGSTSRRIGQHIMNNTLDGFHRHGARRSYNFHTASTVPGRGHGVATMEDRSNDQQHQRQHSHRDEGNGAAAAVAVTLAARLSPMAVGGTRGGSWGGQGSCSTLSSTGNVTGSSGQPRTLPPTALSIGTGNREGPGGAGSGARSPTWPLPRAIPEGAEMSDQDAGGLLIGFFRSVQEKAQTASDELGECTSQADEQQIDQGATGGMHPLIATKRGFRSISSPALTQFADYAEGLPRLQTPPFKRRKSVSSFV